MSCFRLFAVFKPDDFAKNQYKTEIKNGVFPMLSEKLRFFMLCTEQSGAARRKGMCFAAEERTDG